MSSAYLVVFLAVAACSWLCWPGKQAWDHLQGTAVDRIFLWSATGYRNSLSSSFDFSQNTSIVLKAWYLVQVHNPSSEALWVDVLEFTDLYFRRVIWYTVGAHMCNTVHITSLM